MDDSKKVSTNMEDDIARDLGIKEVQNAATADAAEHNMTLREALAAHRKAVFWSMALFGAVISEGYNGVVIGSYYGQPDFLKRFGVPSEATEIGYAIPPAWQSGLSIASTAGGILGLLNGWTADKCGPKIAMTVAIAALTGFIFITVFATSLPMLVAGQVLCGLPRGVFQTLTTAYAAEVCPIQLRGYLAAYVNLCWGVGILLASGVVEACLPIASDWAWRVPFIVQWVWLPPLFAIVCFCPPSPWWLVREGQYEDATTAVKQLTNPKIVSDADADNTVAMMKHTNKLEIQASLGTSYMDCFRGIDRRRTEIVMMTFAMQLLSGQNLIGQGVQFLQTAGISTKLSFSLNTASNSMFIIGTLFSWGLLRVLGRRTIYISGVACMCFVLFIIGALGFHVDRNVNFGMGGLLIGLNFVYNCTLGPVCYTIIAEISSTRLRQKSIVLARISYQLVNVICAIIVPRMLSPLAWNWGPKSGLFWGVSAALSTLYCVIRMPEAKGRSYGELDILFENKVPAWRFKSTKVDQFSAVHEPRNAYDKQDNGAQIANLGQ